jgi:hypothetical protein
MKKLSFLLFLLILPVDTALEFVHGIFTYKAPGNVHFMGGWLAVLGQLIGTGYNLYQGYDQMREGEELAGEGREQMLATAGATDELLSAVDEQKRLAQEAGDLGQERLDQSVTSLLDALASGDPAAYSAIPAFGGNLATTSQNIGMQTAQNIALANAPAVEAAEAEMDVYRGLAQYDLQQGTAAYMAGQQTVNQAYGDLFNMPMDLAALEVQDPEAYDQLFDKGGTTKKDSKKEPSDEDKAEMSEKGLAWDPNTRRYIKAWSKGDRGRLIQGANYVDPNDVISELLLGDTAQRIMDSDRELLSESELQHREDLEAIEMEAIKQAKREEYGLEPLKGAAGLVYTGGGIESSSFRDLIGNEEGSEEEEIDEGDYKTYKEYKEGMGEGFDRADYRAHRRNLRKLKKQEGEPMEFYKSGGKIQDYIGGGSTLSQLLRPGQSFKTGGVEDHDIQEYDISDAKTGEVVAKTTGQEDHMVNEDGSLTVINSEQNESIHDAFKDVDVEMVLKALERNPQKKNVRELLSALNKVFRQKQFQS